MKSIKMVKIVGFCLTALMALSAFMTTPALAKNPRWVICEVGGNKFETGQCLKKGTTNTHETKELKAGETRAISATANGPQELSIASTKIVCKTLKLNSKAVLIGGEPGTNEEILEYGECEVAGQPTCEINGAPSGKGIITTLLINSRLVYLTKEDEEKENQEQVGTLFKPKTGVNFVEITLTPESGGSCSATGTIPVNGEVLCENVKATTHSTEHEINCPSTALKTYWEQNSKQEPVEGKVKKLEFFKVEAKYIGKSVIKKNDEQEWWVV